MKNFRFNIICNITQEPQELQSYNHACRFIGKSAVIKCHVITSTQPIGRTLQCRPRERKRKKEINIADNKTI